MNFIESLERGGRSSHFSKKAIARSLTVGLVVVSLLAQVGFWAYAPTPALAFSSSWDFSTAGDYTVTANKVKVTGGNAQLARTPDWWDTNYAYRKKITVTAGSTAVTTSDTITVNTDTAALVSGGKLQADRDDLRVVYWNGSTNSNIDRDYLAEGLGNPTSNNDIRFKAQAAISASGSDAGYYLYYGYGSASVGPINLANVYRYYEPFSSDPVWSTTGTGWTVASGRLQKTANDGAADRFAGCRTGTNCVTYDQTKSWYAESTFRRTSASNSVSGTAFFNNLVAPTSGYWAPTFYSGSAAEVDIWRNVGNLTPATGTPTVTILQNTDHRETLRFIGGSCPSGQQVRVWVDGTQVNDATENSASNCPTNLIPGVHVWNSTAEWDDYKVWQNVGESTGLGTEETTYPNDDPTVQPNTAVTFDRLDSFTATTSGTGTVRFVVSNDGGTSWLYHNGSVWTTSDGSYAQANTAAQINSAATSFPVGSRSFLYRGILRSDGTQTALIDTVTINGNRRPNTPTLTTPADGSTVSTVTPTLTLTGTDDDSDAVRYTIQVDTSSAFNTGNLTTYNQATSQTGWSGQDALSGTGYASGTSASFTFPSALNAGQTYYWRVQSVDPNGVNTSTSYSATGSFVAPGALSASGIQASTITTTSAIILWTTSNAATSSVEYGTTTAYGSTASLSGTRTSHQVALGSLAPATTYHYRVSGTDGTGQSYVSADQTFTTIGSTVITNVVVTPLSKRSVLITWTTNHNADSKVRYGTTTAYGSEVYDATPVTDHSLTISNLEPGVTYHYEVLSVGNTSTNDADATFVGPLDAPTILEPVEDATYATVTPVKIIGLAKSGQRVTVFVDGTEDGSTTAATTSTGTGPFSYTLRATLSPGEHGLTVTGTTGSETSPASAPRTIMVVGPSIAPTLYTPFFQDGVNPRVIIRGLAPAGAKLEILIDGKVVKTLIVPDSSTGIGSFTATLSTKGLAAGTHSVEVIAYDENDKPSKSKTAATFTIKNGAVTPTTKQGFSHVVQGGESLWLIAQEVYGDGRLYTKLVSANKAKFPSLATNASFILPGWVLVVPK